MTVWFILWFLVIAAMVIFAVVNWSVLMAPVAVNLIVVQSSLPLGAVLLGAMAIVGILFLLFLVWLETRTLVHIGAPGSRSAYDVVTARVSELQADLDRQLASLKTEQQDSIRNISANIAHLEMALTTALKERSRAPVS